MNLAHELRKCHEDIRFYTGMKIGSAVLIVLALVALCAVFFFDGAEQLGLNLAKTYAALNLLLVGSGITCLFAYVAAPAAVRDCAKQINQISPEQIIADWQKIQEYRSLFVQVMGLWIRTVMVKETGSRVVPMFSALRRISLTPDEFRYLDQCTRTHPDI